MKKGSSRPSATSHPHHADDDVPRPGAGFSDEETEEIEERRPLRAAVLYEIVRTEGEGELARTFNALWWSGLAAGLSIGLSVIAQALLTTLLPDDNSWKPILEPLGYSVGFIVVIMARQQLFTENTLTAVLPVVVRRRLRWLLVMLRLWGIVLVANLAGCLLFALTIAHTPMLAPAVAANVAELAHHMMDNSATEMFVKGIAAGWLLAALVWMLPTAENAAFFLVGLVTYLIALGGFTHVIAGSTEAFFLWVRGELAAGEVLLGFLLPTLAGNVFGGTVLFAVISYAQVREELVKD